MYLFIRNDLGIPFYSGKHPLDTSLQKLFDAIKGEEMKDVVADIFKDIVKENVTSHKSSTAQSLPRKTNVG